MYIEQYMQCPLHIIIYAFNNFLIAKIAIYRKGETFDMKYKGRLSIMSIYKMCLCMRFSIYTELV